MSASALHDIVRTELEHVRPSTATEQAHLVDALAWVDSGAPLCRSAKPATPPKHLVVYFALVDGDYILLVDHKNAMRWLPPGGHVEPGEEPRETVSRELREELGLQVAPGDVEAPLMVTVSQTVGISSGHTDVSLWYRIPVARTSALVFDTSEFNAVRWYHFSEAPLARSDPYLGQFLNKLRDEAEV